MATYNQLVEEAKRRGLTGKELAAAKAEIEKAMNRARGQVSSLGEAQALSQTGKIPIAGGGKYTIQAGDSLFSLAGDIYGDQRYAEQLLAANPQLGGTYRPGDEITLPVLRTGVEPVVSYDFMQGVINQGAASGNAAQVARAQEAQTYLNAQMANDPRFAGQLAASGAAGTPLPQTQPLTGQGTPEGLGLPQGTARGAGLPSMEVPFVGQPLVGDTVRPAAGGSYMQTGAGGVQQQGGLRGETGGQSNPAGSGILRYGYANSQQFVTQNFQQQTGGAGLGSVAGPRSPGQIHSEPNFFDKIGGFIRDNPIPLTPGLQAPPKYGAISSGGGLRGTPATPSSSAPLTSSVPRAGASGTDTKGLSNAAPTIDAAGSALATSILANVPGAGLLTAGSAPLLDVGSRPQSYLSAWEAGVAPPYWATQQRQRQIDRRRENKARQPRQTRFAPAYSPVSQSNYGSGYINSSLNWRIGF